VAEYSNVAGYEFTGMLFDQYRKFARPNRQRIFLDQKLSENLYG
jgi:hypothetical protein